MSSGFLKQDTASLLSSKAFQQVPAQLPARPQSALPAVPCTGLAPWGRAAQQGWSFSLISATSCVWPACWEFGELVPEGGQLIPGKKPHCPWNGGRGIASEGLRPRAWVSAGQWECRFLGSHSVPSLGLNLCLG